MTYERCRWGPPFITDKINEDFRKGLLDRGLRLNNDCRGDLAGHIDHESEFLLESDKKYFVENMQKHIQNFKEHSDSHLSRVMFTELKLQKLWINFMKKGEFNPPHTHSADITFVIYLDVPKEIYQEELLNTDTNGGPGVVYFNYGDPANHWACYMQKFKPQTGDIFIFPTNLHHMVAPFRSDVTRISVSGNFEILK